MMRKGAVGSSWNAERNSVNVKPHMTKKRGVNSRSDMNREVYVVGVISDTHGLVRPGIAAAVAGGQLIGHARGRVRPGPAAGFAGVHLIVRAGAVGGSAVLEALSKIAPVDAVYGNVDD